MSEEEKQAIEGLKLILKEWQKIVDIEDDMERDIEMTCYSEEMPFYKIKTVLNYIDKLQKELEEKTTILMAGAEKVKQLQKELDDKVEILDTPKKIEKIKTLKYDIFNKKQKLLYENMVKLADKLNEIIDKINEMENNK